MLSTTQINTDIIIQYNTPDGLSFYIICTFSMFDYTATYDTDYDPDYPEIMVGLGMLNVSLLDYSTSYIKNRKLDKLHITL